MTNCLSGAKALQYLTIRNGAIVYKAAPPNSKVQVGDFLPTVTRQRKEYYDWRGHRVDCTLLTKTLKTQDPACLDSAPQPRLRSRLPTPRDMAILGLLRRGYSYDEIGRKFSVSRTLVHKVANKLRANGINPAPNPAP
jgi:hypothetical protein